MLFAPFHAESGRSDAVNTITDFVLTPNSTSAFKNFTIVDDDVLEFDEIFTAEFSFSPEIANTGMREKDTPEKHSYSSEMMTVSYASSHPNI